MYNDESVIGKLTTARAVGSAEGWQGVRHISGQAWVKLMNQETKSKLSLLHHVDHAVKHLHVTSCVSRHNSSCYSVCRCSQVPEGCCVVHIQQRGVELMLKRKHSVMCM